LDKAGSQPEIALCHGIRGLCESHLMGSQTTKNLQFKEQFMDFPSTTSRSRGEREDQFTSSIESQTSQIPSTGYLGAAIASMAGSAVLKIMGKDNWALFVGQWAPAFLIMGVYNKMVKQHGSDAYSRAA
jgi:hypothetical protein